MRSQGQQLGEAAVIRWQISTAPDCAIVPPEANSGTPSRSEIEKMARRRFQAPSPFREGHYWWLFHWQDEFVDGKRIRKRKRTKLAPAAMPEREVKKIAGEFLRPLNQGLVTVGAAISFMEYVEGTYGPIELPLMAKATQGRYAGVLANYLLPEFGKLCLRDLTPLTLQKYFSGMAASKTTSTLSFESKDKIRDVLSSVLGSAKKYGLLVTNPAEGIRLPRDNRGHVAKPYVEPTKFAALLTLIPEPYSTMAYVAVFTGLRVSELVGLRWRNVHADSISIEQRFCRGDWGAPKSKASNATIAVNQGVLDRLTRLKTLTVEVKAGRALRKYRVVRSCGPDDLVFQSLKTGSPMRDNNILTRHIKPAGRILGMPWLNWRCLRTSHATWLKLAGADVKDAQAQMRHSRASTTLDVYQQFVPESQRKVVDRLSQLADVPITFQ